jgi:serine/threonine protein kinase
MSGQGPRTIGSFAIERELGSGGMGVVLLGRHATLERRAVLKRLRPELAASDELVARFAREAKAAAAVHHQNVVAVYDWIAWRGDHYIAQEFVDGVDLRAALAQVGRFPWRIAALLALEIARGLEAIHARATVHRDLKPANVLLGRSGEVKIADFGIALDRTGDGLTRPGTALGSPPYVAPEQLLGERADARSDLFALGVVLYELLAGAPPFREPAEGEEDTLLERIQRGRFPNLTRAAPGTPRWLARLAHALLRARPRRRPAAAQLVRRQLERRLGAFPAEVRLELAGWLWQEGVFQPREGDTVVLSTAEAGEGGAPAWLRWTLAAAVAGALLSAAFVRVEPEAVASLLAAAKGGIPAAAAPGPPSNAASQPAPSGG